MPKENEEFLNDVEPQEEVDIFDQLHPEEEPEVPEKPEGGDDVETPEEDDDDELIDGFKKMKPRNRRERRLMAKLDAERGSSIQLAEKLTAKSDAEKAIEDSDYLKAVERIYGTDSPEAMAATDILKQALMGVAKHAEESAYQRVARERAEAEAAERHAQEQLDGYLDEIEDTYGIELTDKQAEDFTKLLVKMSPTDPTTKKVVAYANPHAVWEVFKERTRKQGNGPTAKKLATRSLTNSTSPDKSNLKDESAERFLKESGII